jgi:hypothetical protein
MPYPYRTIAIPQALPQLIRGLRAATRDQGGRKFPDLLFQEVNVSPRGQR